MGSVSRVSPSMAGPYTARQCEMPLPKSDKKSAHELWSPPARPKDIGWHEGANFLACPLPIASSKTPSGRVQGGGGLRLWCTAILILPWGVQERRHLPCILCNRNNVNIDPPPPSKRNVCVYVGGSSGMTRPPPNQ